MAGSPRIIARPTTRSPAACRRARVRQGQAFGGAEEAPSLTAAARDGDGNMRSGRKNARGAGRTKEWNDKGRQKWRDAPLTKKAPYKRAKRQGSEKKGAPNTGPHAMVRLLARVIGIGIETADMLVREVLSRKLRDRRAVARYAGLTGSPDESGLKRREKGLAKAGNARVRRGVIQLAWRFLMFQKDSALAQWYRMRTEGPSGARKTTMIVALARKLLIALWRLVTTGEVPDGVELRPAA